MHTLSVSLVAVVCLATSASAKAFVNKEMLTDFEFGVVCNIGGKAVAAPGTTAGKRIVVSGLPYVAKKTAKIPVIRGLTFGVMASGKGPDILQGVAMTISHPPFTDGSGTKERYKEVFGPPAPSFSGYTFDLPSEMVPGVWSVQADWNGQVLYRVEFEVVDASAMPDFRDPCATAHGA